MFFFLYFSDKCILYPFDYNKNSETETIYIYEALTFVNLMSYYRRHHYGRGKWFTSSNYEELKDFNKLVIRNLPPAMTEIEFREQIAPFPEHEYFYFCEPDWSLGSEATSRAHITFKNSNDFDSFISRFDGYVFVDSKGNEYPAVVQISPFQGHVQSRFLGKDNWVNTFENAPHYQDFVDKLKLDEEATKKQSHNKIDFILKSKKVERIQATPLLKYLKKKEHDQSEYQKKWLESRRLLQEEEAWYYMQLELFRYPKQYEQTSVNQTTEIKIEDCTCNKKDETLRKRNKEKYPLSRSKREFEYGSYHQKSISRRDRKKKENETKFIVHKATESAEKKEHILNQSDNNEQEEVVKNINVYEKKGCKVGKTLSVLADNSKSTTAADADECNKTTKLASTATANMTRKACGAETGAIPKQGVQQINAVGERHLRKKDCYYKDKYNRQIQSQ